MLVNVKIKLGKISGNAKANIERYRRPGGGAGSSPYRSGLPEGGWPAVPRLQALRRSGKDALPGAWGHAAGAASLHRSRGYRIDLKMQAACRRQGKTIPGRLPGYEPGVAG